VPNSACSNLSCRLFGLITHLEFASCALISTTDNRTSGNGLAPTCFVLFAFCPLPDCNDFSTRMNNPPI